MRNLLPSPGIPTNRHPPPVTISSLLQEQEDYVNMVMALYGVDRAISFTWMGNPIDIDGLLRKQFLIGRTHCKCETQASSLEIKERRMGVMISSDISKQKTKNPPL